MADAGYREIMLPIIPPWARIAPGSKVEAGKSPGLYNPIAKDWSGMPKWQHHVTTAGDIAEWSSCPDCPSIGVRTGTLVAFDMDVVESIDKARRLAVVVRDHLTTWAGTPHLRTRSNSVRWASIYQAEADALNMAKQVIRFLDASTRVQLGKLELLGYGQQIVVEGVHHSGVMLDWPIRRLGNLPRIDRTQISMYLEALSAVLAPLGIVVERGKASNLYVVEGNRLPIGDPSLKAVSLDALAVALRHIDCSKLEYDPWMTIMRAIKAACGGQADFLAAVVVPWALAYPSNTPEIILEKLDGIADSELGATFLDRKAREGGYRGPPLAGDFTALPPTPSPSVIPAAPDDWIAAPATTPPSGMVPITTQAPAVQNPRALMRRQFESGEVLLRHRYCVDLKSWVVFDDVFGTWGIDDGGRVTELAILGWLESAGHEKLVTTQNAMNIRRAGEGSEKVRISIEAFDADPLWLNTPMGVVDLRPGGTTLMPSPGHHLMMQTNVAPTSEVGCPTFERCLGEWADGDDDLAETILSLGASMLFGDPPGAFLVNLHGIGRNGKSLFMGLMRHIMGSYFTSASTATISGYERSGSAARSDLVALHRKRVVFVPEYESRRLNVGLVKAWTGGDGIAAREMYTAQRDALNVRPGRLVLSTNNALELPADDPAMNARLRLIPWRRSFADDPSMLPRLKAEAPGILAKLILYGREHEGALFMAESAIEATAEALDQTTPARRLVRAALKPGDGELSLDQIIAHVRNVVPILFPGDQHVAGLLMHDNAALGSIILRNYEGRYQRRRLRVAGSDRRPVSYTGIALRDPMDVWTNG